MTIVTRRPTRRRRVTFAVAAAALVATALTAHRAVALRCLPPHLSLERLDVTVDGQVDPNYVVAPGTSIFLFGQEAGRVELSVTTGPQSYREEFHAVR
jgi:hypothetical protein